MEKYIKPIQPTPTLSGSDAKAIIKEALATPSNNSISKNERRLADLEKIFTNNKHFFTENLSNSLSYSLNPRYLIK